MARQRTWYKNYIGYCFNDNGREIILEDIFYFEDENGKITGTGYELRHPDEKYGSIYSFQAFKRIVDQTVLPKRYN